MPTSTPQSLSSDALTVYLVFPNRTTRLPLKDYDNIEVKKQMFGPAVCTFDMPLMDSQSSTPALHPILASLITKNSTTRTAYAWALSECGVEVYYWGQLFFDGCIVAMDDDDPTPGHPGIVKVEAWSWEQWFLSARDVKGTNGARYSAGTTVAVDNAMKALMRANTQAPTTGIEPSWYGSNGIDREEFGSFAVSIAADSSSHPSSKTLKFDNGAPLWDSLLEQCRKYSVKISGSWSGATYTLTTTYPATGTDRSSTVKFTRENGTLLRFTRRVDRGTTANVVEARGKRAQGSGQPKAYAVNSASYADVGLRETGETQDTADSTDAQENADFIIAQVGGAITHYQAELTETDACYWYANFNLGDKITIYDSKRAITVADIISGLELKMTNPGPPILKIITGIEPGNADNNSGRGGGGRGGARRAGGPPKKKGGELDTWRTINMQGGNTPLTADQPEDNLSLRGETATRIRVRTYGIDPGSSEGGTETAYLFVEGTYFSPCPACNGYVTLWTSNAGNVKLLCRSDSDFSNTQSGA